MKILQFCYKPPFPALDGGSMGMHYVTEGLINNGHEVKVLSFHSKKHPCRVDKLPVEYVEKTKFETVFVDLDIKPIPALVAYLCGESYHVKRFINEQMKRKLVEILKAEDFDIIQVESIFLTPYLPIMRRFSNAKIVLRAPNIEHKIWERIYKATKTPFKRGYIKHLALTLKYYELNHINDYDAVSPVTEVDAEYFRENGLRKKCKGIPFGMNPPELLSDVLEEKNTIFHIGSMNWHPNEQGIKWFLEECWDKIRQTTPNVQAYFAGRYMPNWLKNTSIEGVHIVGEVEDSIRFMTSKQIMVVPLLSGSGIRIKIIEAMSIGKTVIATTIAAEGIMYEDGKNIIIANSAEEFASAVKYCVENPDKCKSIGDEAYKLIAERYSNDQVVNQLVTLYKEII
jgi:glycosyltransferase involved in cell wall biosynthesis